MRRLVLLAAILAFLAGCSKTGSQAEEHAAAATSAETGSAPASWVGLGPGRHRAVPFDLGIPPELDGVQKRFAAAAAEHNAWLQEYLKKLDLPPGAPLPYHPNFGISEDEYQRLLAAYQHPLIVERAGVDLEVRVEDRALRFSAPRELAPLANVRVEASSLRYGTVEIAGPKPVVAHSGKFGVWSGFAWQRDASTEPRHLDALEFEMGRIDGSGRRFVHLHRRLERGGALAENVELLAWIDD